MEVRIQKAPEPVENHKNKSMNKIRRKEGLYLRQYAYGFCKELLMLTLCLGMKGIRMQRDTAHQTAQESGSWQSAVGIAGPEELGLQRIKKPQGEESRPETSEIREGEDTPDDGPISSTPASPTTSNTVSSPVREIHLDDMQDVSSASCSARFPSEPETLSPSSLLQAAHTAILELEKDKVVEAHKFLLPDISPEDFAIPQLMSINPAKGGVLDAKQIVQEQPLVIRKEEAKKDDIKEEEVKNEDAKVRIRKVDIPLVKVSWTEITDEIEYEEKVVRRHGKGMPSKSKDVNEVAKDIEGGVKGPRQSDPVRTAKPRTYIIPKDEDESEDSSDGTGEYDPGIQAAQQHSSSEDEVVQGKRKKGKQSADPAKRQVTKKAKQNNGKCLTVEKTVKFKRSVKIYEFSVPDLNHPGARFVVPEEGGAVMKGLESCEVKFDLELTWSEDYEDYNKLEKSCTTCRYCERPRCGLCAGCNTKPGGVRKSGHDECHWRKCPYRSWKSEDKAKETGGVINDVVIIRIWIHHVNSFCMRKFDDQTKRIVRRRLQLYNSMLNMTAEGERNFWMHNEEAFQYPRLNIRGGDKFHTVFKRFEVARYKMFMHSRHTKIELGLNPNKSFDSMLFQANLWYRASLDAEDSGAKNIKGAAKAAGGSSAGKSAGPSKTGNTVRQVEAIVFYSDFLDSLMGAVPRECRGQNGPNWNIDKCRVRKISFEQNMKN